MSIGPFDFANLPLWLQFVLGGTAILAAIVGVIAFVRRTWPVIVSFVKTVISLQVLPEFMEKTSATLARQNEQLGVIHHEVQFNNGSSVKDGIVRVERTTERLEEGIRGLYDRMNDAERELEQTHPRPLKPITPRKTPKKENPE